MSDAINVHTSKAGAVAQYESDLILENLMREIWGQEPRPDFDGLSTCFPGSG